MTIPPQSHPGSRHLQRYSLVFLLTLAPSSSLCTALLRRPLGTLFLRLRRQYRTGLPNTLSTALSTCSRRRWDACTEIPSGSGRLARAPALLALLPALPLHGSCAAAAWPAPVTTTWSTRPRPPSRPGRIRALSYPNCHQRLTKGSSPTRLCTDCLC